MCDITFVIGSARSGTTILGEVLDCHPDIAQWYEPYYLWRRFFLCKDNEIWKPEELNDKVKQIIRKEHKVFLKKSKRNILVEKMPSHSFNIKLLLNIFPDAKWIHIVRDGRDITLSMKKEWIKRTKIVQNKDYLHSIKTAINVIKRAPYLRYKFMLVLYELNSNFSFKPSKYLNKAKWKGRIGWGARFNGWEKKIDELTSIQFNAMQWLETVTAAQEGLKKVAREKKLVVKYENLMKKPKNTLKEILNFMNLEYSEKFYNKIPKFKSNNYNKWNDELSRDEVNQIKTILSPMLEDLGYLKEIPW